MIAYRCEGCRSLTLDIIFREEGCSCGSRTIRGAGNLRAFDIVKLNLKLWKFEVKKKLFTPKEGEQGDKK